ncbi:NACHT domain-containing protein [Rhizobium leguminosarum]|uniref:NACHT domain-containing protein n=1 Tax=Rhizobium leguminosarum TaxID=384 RepID=UPI003F996B8A
MDEFVELRRNFFSVPKDATNLADYEDMPRKAPSSTIHWDELEIGYRTIILAEAGSGKTAEIQQAAKRIRAVGKRSFFLRLEYLLEEFEDAFDGGEKGSYDEFKQWLTSNDEAWLFLDSVDEARLSDPRDFEKAIRRLAKKIGAAGQRAHLFVTSRISEWRPKADLDLLVAQLPYIVPKEAAPSSADIIEVNDDDLLSFPMNNEGTEPKPAEVHETFRVVSLGPLDDYQIKRLARVLNVTNETEFFEQIERHDVSDYLSRPQDFIELVNFWKSNGRIGTRKELLKADIEQRLRERDPNRDRFRPLAREKAYVGSKRLAAAVTYQKLSRIQVPDPQVRTDCVDPSAVLDDWSTPEVLSLLSRPIFDQAIYGTVRFHHRSVREYLCAQWLVDLLAEGKSRREIESLLFKTQYGLEVVVPTSRPILPWLALRDQRIRERLMKVAPEILFHDGDPSKLPHDDRATIIEDVCRRIKLETLFRSSIDYSAIRRYATDDLEPVIKELLVAHKDDPNINSLLLGFVWQGKYESCRETAFEIAVDPTHDKYSRIAALRALNAVGTEQQQIDAARLIANSRPLPSRRLISEVIDLYVPKRLPIAEVLSALEHAVEPDEFRYSELERSLRGLSDRLSENELVEMLHGLATLLKRSPFAERHDLELSTKFRWLLPIAAGMAAKLVGLRSKFALDHSSLAAISLTSLDRNWNGNNDDRQNFRDLVTSWDELNKALFWFDVADARRARVLENNGRLIDWWHARIFRDYWEFSPEQLPYFIEQIEKQDQQDDKLVALTMAHHLYVQAGRPADALTALRRAVKGNGELESSLKERLRPVKLTDTERKWKQEERGYKRRREDRDKRQADIYEHNRQWLIENHAMMLENPDAAKGAVWQCQANLHQEMRGLGPDRNKLAYTNWRDLEKSYGSAVAKSFRDSIVGYWRKYQPPLRSEGIENPDSIPHAIALGLSGLAIESNETADWPSRLTSDEAARALRYCLWEMNGFPSWLQALSKQFSKIVHDVFANEIEWEIKASAEDVSRDYLISDLVWHGQDIEVGLPRTIMAILRGRLPASPQSLENLLLIIVRESISDEELSAFCAETAAQASGFDAKGYLIALLISVDPDRGIEVLRQTLETIADQEKKTDFCMHLAVQLVGGRRSGGKFRERYKTAVHLRHLYFVLHEHIRREDDIDRAGGVVYSPGLRDNAQDARNSVFKLLSDIPGKETFLALKEIAENYPDVETRGWMMTHAHARAIQDSDLPVWNPADAKDFAREAEFLPSTHHQLFELARSRLLDLKDDLENGDTSIADILVKADQETQLRNYVGGWLRDRAKGRYVVPQEDELADSKRPDLRFLATGFDGPVPIELKIADRWSGPKLFERVENQLCNDYLRDKRSSNGIFLLLRNGSQSSWRHPTMAVPLNFRQLCEELQLFSNSVIASRSDIEEVTIVGIDLTARSTPARKNLGPSAIS